MARINIQNAEVTSVMRTGTGFRCQETWTKKNGEPASQKFVVWSDQPVGLGDTVNVTGIMSLKNEEFTNDKGETIKYTAIHVNNPKVDSPLPITDTTPMAATDEWLNANAKPIDMEAPF